MMGYSAYWRTQIDTRPDEVEKLLTLVEVNTGMRVDERGYVWVGNACIAHVDPPDTP